MLKRTLILFSAFCATWSVQAQTFTVVSETENEMVIEASFPEPEMNTISTPQGDAVVFTMPDANPILRKGAPEVPHYAKSVVIDRKARMEMEIIESTYQIINDVTVAPSKGNLYRNVDPASMPFVFGPAYQTSASYPANIAELGDVYIFRDYRGQVVEFNPIQVVGAEQKVRVYSHIKVRISKTDEIGDNPMPATVQSRPTEQYNELYGNRFINFNSGVQRYDVVDELGKMLIIADAEYMTTLEPFIQWKKEKGMDIILTDIADIGNSVSAISNHISDTYDAENVSYVLLVGDEDQVTSELVSNGGGNGYCDPCYGYLTGNDHFPEVLVGRFLVHDTNELDRVITKTLEYEIDPYTATDWFSTAIGIGSNEGAGNGDDGEADWQHNNNIKSDLIDYNYNTVWELYDGNHTANSPTGGATADGSGNPSASTLIGLIEDGCTMINYTGHGDHDIIVTTSYDNGDIYNTNNNHFYPFMVVVGCCVGDFDETYGSGDCFGEAWLKGNNSGPITGGIGGGFSSVLQSWAPPMEAQDEMNKLICETGQQSIRHSLGSILFHGCASMIEAYGSGGNEMMDTWCFFGDPSVVMRTAFPSTLTATHDASTFIGVSDITVNCDTEDALICATWEGEILGTALVSGGLANITFNQPVNGVGQILITATAYNTIPYQGTMDVVPADGPYVIDEDIAVDDSNGNNNDQVDYNESVMMDISVVNVGIETAFGVSATLTTTDSWITITDDNHYYGDITPDAVEFGNGGYAFDVADGVEDQHIAMFTLNIEDTDGNTWTMNFNVIINAPELDTAEMLTIDDSTGNNNGRLDSGESVTITIPTMNDGHSASVEAIGDLSVSGGYLTIDQSSVTLGTINADGSVNATFDATVDADVPDGTLIDLIYEVNAGMYSATRTYTESIDLIVEDWETGDMSQFPWQTNGDSNWYITNQDVYEGTNCMRSGIIGDGDNTTLELSLNILSAGEITFAVRVSTEQGWDILTFYIDGTEVDSWSGELAWSEVSYPVSTGNHTFKWTYAKDAWCCVEGDDACRVDNIIFPPYEDVAQGVVESTAAFGVAIYPNPAHDVLNIQLDDNLRTQITVYNQMGQLMASDIRTVNGVTQMATGNLAAGIYFLQLSNDKGTEVLKFIVE